MAVTLGNRAPAAVCAKQKRFHWCISFITGASQPRSKQITSTTAGRVILGSASQTAFDCRVKQLLVSFCNSRKKLVELLACKIRYLPSEGTFYGF